MEAKLNQTFHLSSKQIFFIILGIAIVSMFLCTKASPLYPLQDWGDVNIYFTIGKSIPDGMVPYRDLFDHKGPFVYFLFMLISFISYNSFVGLFLLEIVCSFFFLFLSYKILCLFLDESCIILLPILSAIAYTVPAISHGGNLEELCYPIYAFFIFVTVKSLKENTVPSKVECFIIGITSSCILWSKYTLLGIFIFGMLVPFYTYLRKRLFKETLIAIFMVVVGVVCITIPILLYFGLNHAIKDLYHVYFYSNIFDYSISYHTSPLDNMIIIFRVGLNSIRRSNLPAFILIILGFIYFIKKRQSKLALHLAIMVLGSAFFVFYGKGEYMYYAATFTPFILFGTALIFEYILPRMKKVISQTTKSLIISSGISIIVIIIFSPNLYMLIYEKEDLPQYQVKEVIEGSGIEDPIILAYGCLDEGFYTVMEQVPQFKYFFRPNIKIKEITVEQDNYVAMEIPDFILTHHADVILPGYRRIGYYQYAFEGVREWYLYGRGEEDKVKGK